MTSRTSLSQADVAQYIGDMAAELSEMGEGARLDALATILYAAHLEARRSHERLVKPGRKNRDTE